MNSFHDNSLVFIITYQNGAENPTSKDHSHTGMDIMFSNGTLFAQKLFEWDKLNDFHQFVYESINLTHHLCV